MGLFGFLVGVYCASTCVGVELQQFQLDRIGTKTREVLNQQTHSRRAYLSKRCRLEHVVLTMDTMMAKHIEDRKGSKMSHKIELLAPVFALKGFAGNSFTFNYVVFL